jgi:hypothetical protein
MTIPHYISKNESDVRCIKSGWYAMDHDRNLSSGPFPTNERLDAIKLASTAEVKHLCLPTPTGVEGGVSRGTTMNRPIQGCV